MNAVLPVLHVLLEATDKYVENKDCKVSQALPSPKHQLRCLPVQHLQSGREREDSLQYCAANYNSFLFAKLNITVYITYILILIVSPDSRDTPAM